MTVKRPTNGNLKLILATVTSIAVAWIGAWQTVNAGKGNLSPAQREEVIRLVEEGPYNEDRKLLQALLQKNEVALTDIQEDLQEVKLSQARLEVKVNGLIAKEKKNR